MKKIYSFAIFICLAGISQQNYLAAQNTFPSTGNVGIGIGIPNAKLEIVNTSPIHALLRNTSPSSYTSLRLYNDLNSNIRGLEIDYSGSGYTGSIINGGPIGEAAAITTSGAYPLIFGTSNTARFTILSGGNIGIGTSTPNKKLEIFETGDNSNISTLLKLNQFNTGNSLNGTGTAIEFAIGNLYNTPATSGKITVANTYYNNNSKMIFSTKNNNVLNDQMVIDNNGFVGIGTPTPSQKLEVAGRVYANGDQFKSSVTSGSWVTGGFLSATGVVATNGDFAIYGETTPATRFVIKETTGNVGIATTNPQYSLDVCGTIRAREVRVNLIGCDFVFEDRYKLMPLNELEQFIKLNKHLPEIAPAKEMETIDGVQIGEMQSKLLQKVEELTLYSIQQQKQLNSLQKELETLKEVKGK